MMKVEMRDLKSPEVQATSDAELEKVITGERGKMRRIASAFRQADDIGAYMRSLKK